MGLHIKHMVCPRCIMVVREELQRAGAEVLHVELGYAEIGKISPARMNPIEETLSKCGFALMCDKEEVLAEEIKA